MSEPDNEHAKTPQGRAINTYIVKEDCNLVAMTAYWDNDTSAKS